MQQFVSFALCLIKFQLDRKTLSFIVAGFYFTAKLFNCSLFIIELIKYNSSGAIDKKNNI